MFIFKYGLLSIAILLLLSGCKDSVLLDAETKTTLPTVKAESGDFIIRIRNDGMLGHTDYFNKELVVDPDYYSHHSVGRGDIVSLRGADYRSDLDPHTKLEQSGIVRVIAREGETVQIRKGQIYINKQRLDTFYGNPSGPGLEELKLQMKKADQLSDNEKENLRLRISNYEQDDMKAVEVPKGSVFVLGDNRGRAVDSQSLGPVPLEQVRGKVVGFFEKHVWEVSPTFVVPFPGTANGQEELRLRGEPGKLAIVDQLIVAGKPYQNYWFFWGKAEELEGKPEIIGVRQDNENDRRIVFTAGGVSGPLASAAGHIPPSNMTIPEPGLWRLEAYIGDKYFGSLVVDVQVNQ